MRVSRSSSRETLTCATALGRAREAPTGARIAKGRKHAGAHTVVVKTPWWLVAGRRRARSMKQRSKASPSSSSPGMGEPSDANRFAALDGFDEELLATSSEAKSNANATPKKLRRPIVWIDLEMTGLDPDAHTILEIAVLVTDGQLRNKKIGPNLVIHHSDLVIDSMNEWSEVQHAKSGLTERVRESTISMEQAEQQVLDFVRSLVDEGRAQLAGNSLTTDVMFLRKHMPDLYQYMHYRIIDVSSIGELCQRWFPDKFRQRPKKSLAHTAYSDIEESLQELQFYRDSIFIKR